MPNEIDKQSSFGANYGALRMVRGIDVVGILNCIPAVLRACQVNPIGAAVLVLTGGFILAGWIAWCFRRV
jgi:hypothetical protein